MLTPRNWILTGLVAGALTLFAMPLTQVDAQRNSRGQGSSGSSGGKVSGGGSRSTPAPSPRSTPAPSPRSTPAPSPRSTPAPSPRNTPAPAPRSTPAPAPRSSSPSRSTPEPSPRSTPAPSPRSSTPQPSRSTPSTERPGSSLPSRTGSTAPSPGSRNDDAPRSTYRSAPATRTPSGVPTIENDRPTRTGSNAVPRPGNEIPRTSDSRNSSGISRADNISRTAERSSAGNVPRNSDTTRGADAPGSRGITQRSTLTDFGGADRLSTNTTATRAAATEPNRQEMLAGPTPFHYSGYGYVGSYYGYGHNHHHHSSWGFRWYLGGGFSIGFSSGWYGGWGWSLGWSLGRHIYLGAFAAAILVGHAWHIVPHHGFWGYYGGSHCYWLPHHHWRTWHSFHYHDHFCRVNRPYWYGYTRWYDYRPYSYGYASLVYDDLYDDGYDDGYTRGYNRGYHDGADDAGGLQDDRRRDSIGKPARPREADSAHDRAIGNAQAQYRTEMNRGGEAFQQGDYLRATGAFKEAAILNPESADARYMLAVSAMASGKYAFSAFALRRAIALDAAGSNLDLDRMFGGPDAVKAQRRALDRELKSQPENPDLLLLAGYAALRSGDAATAAEALDRALQHNAQDAAARRLHKEALDALENN